ncbi:MAG: GH3 auxin-responsive promoter family protein, partial [Pseudomonadota bacterium]
MLDATPILRLYARHRLGRLAASRPAAVQEQQLLSLAGAARHTRFGKDHHFSGIKSVDDFQRQVPLRRYEDFWTDYWSAPFPRLTDVSWPGKIPYFAVTSGTTADTTKYIPLTAAMIQSNVKAGLTLLAHHLANRPNSRIFGGKNFMLGGSTKLVAEAPGVWSGDLSGIATRRIPWYARSRS